VGLNNKFTIMMSNITKRQRKILKAVILEFMKNAEPVSSGTLVDEYDIDVSSATVRNDMSDLSDRGFLEKTHTSAGRTPTTTGLRYFIQELMEEDELGNKEKVDIKTSFFKKRFEVHELMKEVLAFLSGKTGYASIGLVGDNFRYKGISSLTDYEELRKIEVFESILRILENRSLIERIFEKGKSKDVCILIGEECEINKMNYCAFVFSPFDYLNNQQGYIGLLGPKRMRYTQVLPVMRYVKSILEESVKGW
jgi:heat-inducible transcriptional repressor